MHVKERESVVLLQNIQLASAVAGSRGGREGDLERLERSTHRVTREPMGPQPMTNAVSPALKPETRTACHATESGSASAAMSTASGRRRQPCFSSEYRVGSKREQMRERKDTHEGRCRARHARWCSRR